MNGPRAAAGADGLSVLAARLAELHREFQHLARLEAARSGGLVPACPGDHHRRPSGPPAHLIATWEG